MHDSAAQFLSTRKPCPHCGAGRSVATTTEGFSYCHACSATSSTRTTSRGRNLLETFETVVGNLIPQSEITFQDFPKRGIRLDAVKKYRYGVAEYKGKSCQVAQWYDDTGTVRAQKLRFADKSFAILGDKSYMGLYGLHTLKEQGKRVIITEGELDCLAASQALESWPVLSLPNGASTARKALLKDLERLERFDMIILAFDQDEAGQKAVDECVDIFSPGKVRIASFPLKDACDMVEAGRSKEFVQAIFDARQWRPEGIVSGEDILKAMLDAPKKQGIPYKWSGWNTHLLGRRPQELVMLVAGTGSGKTTFCHDVAGQILKEGTTVGYLALEEYVGKSALGILGSIEGRNWENEDPLPREAIDAAHKQYGDRLHLLNHFGSQDAQFLLSKIRFLIKALGCRVIFLDHISIAISGLMIEDERRAIDKMMTDLRSLVQETKVTMYVISHLRRTKGTPAEEGGQISLEDLRGSQALAQLSDIVLAFERNSQSDDPDVRNTTTCRCLKNRPIGRTGVMCRLKYDEATNSLTEIDEEDATEVFDEVSK